MLEVYRPGSLVRISGRDVIATVCQARIGTAGVTYWLAWWDGRDRIAQEVEACEIAGLAKEATNGKERIGFAGERSKR